MTTEIDMVFVRESKLHCFYVRVEITCFTVSMETDFVFVMVVDIDLISVWGIELDLISVWG